MSAPVRLRLATLSAAAALLLLAAPAAGHAWLLRATPAPDQSVPEAPEEALLVFTERVQAEHTAAHVTDANGTRVDLGDEVHPDGRPDAVRVRLPALPNGTYVVHWRTLSVDTHTAEGSYVFGVGNATLDPGAHAGHGSAGHAHASPGEVAVRWLGFAGLLVATGAAAFAAARRPAEGSRPLAALAATAALAGAAGSTLLLWMLAQRLGSGLGAAAATRTGGLVAARAAFLLLLGAAAAWAGRTGARPSRARWALAAAAGLAAILATSSSSHAAAVGGPWSWHVAADAVHLAAGAVWVGGVAALLLLALRPGGERLGDLVFAFSPWALTSLAAVVATGVAASLVHIPSWGAVASSGYGQAVAAKALLLVPLALLGAWNRWRVGPRLAQGSAGPRALAWPLAAEALVMAGVLVAAGVLATVPPPREAADAGAGALEFREDLGEAELVFTISPAPVRVGVQHLRVELRGDVPHGGETYAKFQAPGRPEPEELVPLQEAGHAAWALSGGHMTERGAWTVHLIVQSPAGSGRWSYPVDVV